MREQLKTAYLDYVNNYITVKVFAEHHQVTVADANLIIQMGRVYHETDVALLAAL